ncbi:hypothetical protein NC653_030130 [Populus alba x Populus x berolinensis]|uniref:Uncharacterized protein n=1 Tax=Populus alba x Populus x berolinensis TaxID=444605 RepID=A0AAD6LVE8_9ROSI|nr:hypothetical protein NC653_030130 [Populus alba x Populus x berolinensis]
MKDGKVSYGNTVVDKRIETYLNFPWRPLISIDGSTVYEFSMLRTGMFLHLKAIGQIFTPSFDRPGE